MIYAHRRFFGGVFLRPGVSCKAQLQNAAKADIMYEKSKVKGRNLWT
jgi:hypothetical protein